MPPLSDTPPIGWYVHLPFCTTKCGYCDFYSLPTLPGLVGDLAAALEAEAAARDPKRSVETVYVGGGTPTVLPAEALAAVLRTVTSRTGPVAEFTVEANPSSADELKLDLLRRSGVDRVSFGAQSFDARELAVLQRIHDPRHIVESVRAARTAGFDNVNLDLIYAIPGQTVADWRRTLRRAIDLGTEHLSCYALTYESGTQLTRLRHEGRIVPLVDDLEADLFELTIEELTTAGFEHYEISNFARPGRRCRANLIYWENREYLGLGPSAVSYLDGVRQKNVPDVRRYVEGIRSDPSSIVVERERLSPEARACETAVQMLRLTEGIDAERFRLATGRDARRMFASQIRRFEALELLAADAPTIRLTPRGRLVANRVMMEFLACDAD
ncbi:MAG: radical SAM family heme chaperone HemW, partial [Phycisphaerae bacterium]